MIIWINTSEDQTLTVGLIERDRVIAWKQVAAFRKQAEKLLPTLESLLQKTKTPWGKIKGIAIHPGPGSFTAVRIGVATANALGYGRNVPVVALALKIDVDQDDLAKKITRALAKVKTYKPVRPRYDREPNITYSKK
jgi:tRNA A37 threonylcarbamoyladenosine modification protein TsaB